MRGQLVMVDIVTGDPLSTTALALRQQLQVVFPANRFTHEFLPAKLDAAVWKQLVTRMPFIGLGWNTLDRDKGSREFIGRSIWTIFIVVKNPGAGFGPRYLGDALSTGLFALVSAGVVALQSLTIPGIGKVTVTRAGNAFAEGWEPEHAAMAALEVEVNTAMQVSDLLAGDGVTQPDLSQLSASWTFDGDPVADLTDNGVPT